jgi:hypothetical protein
MLSPGVARLFVPADCSPAGDFTWDTILPVGSKMEALFRQVLERCSSDSVWHERQSPGIGNSFIELSRSAGPRHPLAPCSGQQLP